VLKKIFKKTENIGFFSLTRGIFFIIIRKCRILYIVVGNIKMAKNIQYTAFTCVNMLIGDALAMRGFERS